MINYTSVASAVRQTMFLAVALIGFSLSLSAQTMSLPYQAILIDLNGDRLNVLDVEILIELREISPNGTVIYLSLIHI